MRGGVIKEESVFIFAVLSQGLAMVTGGDDQR
jgi:hypothetical protein